MHAAQRIPDAIARPFTDSRIDTPVISLLQNETLTPGHHPRFFRPVQHSTPRARRWLRQLLPFSFPPARPLSFHSPPPVLPSVSLPAPEPALCRARGA